MSLNRDTTSLSQASLLAYLLRKAGRLLLLRQMACGLMFVASTMLIVVSVAVGLDAMFGFGTGGLIALDVAIAVTFMICVVFAGRRFLRNMFNPRYVARMVEQHLDIHDSWLINAVDLASRENLSGTSASLEQLCVARGEQFAATLVPSQVIDRQPALRALRSFLLVVFVSCLTCVTFHDVYQTVMPRLISPHGDQAPFTLVEFQVQYPKQVNHGENAPIRVQLSGQDMPAQADVVVIQSLENELDRMGRILQRFPMARQSRAKVLTFEKVIRGVTSPVTFYIDTPTGRSKRYQIGVVPVPRVVEATVSYTPPVYTGWPASKSMLGHHAHIEGLAGTRVRIDLRSSLALTSGSLKLRIPGAAVGEANSEVEVKEGQASPESSALSDASARSAIATHLQVLLEVDADDATRGVVEFVIEKSGYFEIELESKVGEELVAAAAVKGSISVLADEVPHVVITEPWRRQAMAPVGWKVPIAIEADDDVRVVAMQLTTQVDRGEQVNTTDGQLVRQLEMSGSDVRQQVTRTTIDLGKLQVRAGDTVSFFASVRDNAPSGPHAATSDRYVIHVISKSQYMDQLRERVLVEDLIAESQSVIDEVASVEKMRESLEVAFAQLNHAITRQGSKVTTKQQSGIDVLNKRAIVLANKQRDFADKLKRRAIDTAAFDSEQAWLDALSELAVTFGENAEAINQVTAPRQSRRTQSSETDETTTKYLRQMLHELQKQKSGISKAAKQAGHANDDFGRIELADQLLAGAQRIEDVIDGQSKLAAALKVHEGENKLNAVDQIRVLPLADRQQRLLDELSDATKQLRALARKAAPALPRTADSAVRLVDEIKELKVLADQDVAQKSLRIGNGGAGYLAANQAATKLASLVSDSMKMEEAASSEFGDTGFKLTRQKLGQTLKQLAKGRQLRQQRAMQNAKNMQAGKNGGESNAMALYGPRSGSESEAGRGKTGSQNQGAGDGRGVNGTGASVTGHETVDPDNKSSRKTNSGVLRGVPVRYRDDVEAYFRNLASEKR